MKKTYERPEAEVISFEAMEQLATLVNEIDSMDISLALGGKISAVDRM